MVLEINAEEVDIVISVVHPDLSFLEEWRPIFLPYHLIIVQDPELEEIVEVPSGFNYSVYTKQDMERILGAGVLSSLALRGHGCRSFGYLVSKKRYIFSLDDDCLPAKDSSGNLINALEQHIANLKSPATPFFFNTLYDPYRKGSDFVRGYPFSLRQGVPCAVSCGLWMNLPDYDAPTQILKPEERNTRYVDAIMTVPTGSLLPMSGINIAFNREIIGPAMFSGLCRSGSSNPQLSRYDTLEDIFCGLCCKIICDHLGYGVKTGLPYVWRKEVGDPMVSLRREFKGVQWLEEIVPFFQLIRLPRSALTVEDCYTEIGKQVKEKLKNVDPLFGEVGSSMENWIKAWKSVSS
eukprot:Gb_38716 [translate_table: standard]